MNRTKTGEKNIREIEGGRKRDREPKEDGTKESDCRDSRNRWRDSKASMHIIDRLSHLIRRTLQFLPSEKYRFRAMRKVYFRHASRISKILFKKIRRAS